MAAADRRRPLGLSELLRQASTIPATPTYDRAAPALSDVFSQEPVPLTEFVTGARYLRNPPLSPEQYEAVRHIERVYYPELYPLMGGDFDPYWAEPVRMVNFVTLEWG